MAYHHFVKIQYHSNYFKIYLAYKLDFARVYYYLG